MGESVRLSVCVVTYERAAFLERCLAALATELDGRAEVVIVDASRSDHAREVRAIMPKATYVHAPQLAGWMTRSRNEALRHVRGELVAFLDDDVVVRPGWQAALEAAFDADGVGAVAGRTCNGLPGEEEYDRPIGRLLPDGSLTDGFAADAPRLVDVDHGIGANMSFRRTVLAALGGFRDDYPGTAIREDTDMFLRVRAMGGRSVFAPEAVVDHLPAPHLRGARFDTRYKLYGRRNHMVLLARDAGIGSRTLWRWVGAQFRNIGGASGLRARAQRLGVTTLGILWGAAAMLRDASWRPTPPQRTDPAGNELRRRLGGAPI
ncbi:GT2 family glycosyltransferase [Agromyces flavus]|uniref:GT2 family glycosyltransferase n=1 Tax=Agromyces flavus TaxID=589382 RepID=A0A1H1Z7E2_9MICO|nr:glycosyltransferase [Agromyces flavus]MCP2366959.1 GT2 family glycosyltransferase [Agromyces flavus]SDT29628.1 Glycosyltransferase, GT2 family [Agromyces flavus]